MTSVQERPTPEVVADDDPSFLRGPLLRVVLPLLGVLLIVLAGVLTVAVLGIAITPAATALAAGGYALLTVGGVVLYRRRHPGTSMTTRPTVSRRNVVGGLVTAVVLLGAVAVAQGLQPSTAERFVSLQSTTSAVYSDGALQVPGSGTVDLGWQLRGYGVELAADPAVGVIVDGTAPADLVVVPDAASDPEGTGYTSGVAGSVTFTAPADAGRHQVVVTVSDPADPAGSQTLVLQLEVTS